LQGFVNGCVGLSWGSQPENEVGPEMLELIRRIKRCEQGATAVEYGLIVSLIVIAMVSALKGVADTNDGMWAHVSNKIVSASDN
jgi:pilus assembly protein Flp/PilA